MEEILADFQNTLVEYQGFIFRLLGVLRTLRNPESELNRTGMSNFILLLRHNVHFESQIIQIDWIQTRDWSIDATISILPISRSCFEYRSQFMWIVTKGSHLVKITHSLLRRCCAAHLSRASEESWTHQMSHERTRQRVPTRSASRFTAVCEHFNNYGPCKKVVLHSGNATHSLKQ